MAIIIKAGNSDSVGDLIRKFKRATSANNIVQIVKDRRYYQKPSQVKAVKKIATNRLRKKARSLKKRKNIGPEVLHRIYERINNGL